MDHAGIIARDYQSIKAKAEEMGVPLQWAIDRKRRYLEDNIKENQADVFLQWTVDQRKQYLKDKIKELEADVAQAVRELAGTGELEHRLTVDRIEGAEKNIRHARFDLSRLKPNAGKGNGVDDTEIERAKEYPIERLLPNQVRRGMTLCPFHEDRHPSMSIKNNRVRCFSCNKTWDTIALVMELRGYEFIEAVKYLTQIGG